MTNPLQYRKVISLQLIKNKINHIFSCMMLCNPIVPWEMEILTIAWKVRDELEGSLIKPWNVFQAHDSQETVFYRKIDCERNIKPFSFFPLFFFLFFYLSSLLMKLQAACDYSHNCAHCTTLDLHFLSHTLSFPWFFKWRNKQQEKEQSNKAPISTLAKYWAVCLFPARLIKVSSLLFVYIYYFWRTFSPLGFVHLFPFFFF